MDLESSLYILSALAHQKYTLSDGLFREIKHNTVPWNLFFFFCNRSGAVVMSSDSKWHAIITLYLETYKNKDIYGLFRKYLICRNIIYCDIGTLMV